MRSKKNIRQLTDEAYQLPVDKIYVIDNKGYHKTFECIAEHIDDIQRAIDKAIPNPIYAYKIELVKYSPDNPDLAALFPVASRDIESNPSFLDRFFRFHRRTDMFLQTDGQTTNVVAHIIPSSRAETENIRLLTETIKPDDVSVSRLKDMLVEFVSELNKLNIETLANADYPVIEDDDSFVIDRPIPLEAECDFSADGELLSEDNFAESSVSRQMMPEPVLYGMPAPEPAVSQGTKPNVRLSQKAGKLCKGMPAKERPLDPELYKIADRIRRDIETLQRNNGINILMEKLSGAYLLTQIKANVTQVSPIVIDDKFRILLPDYDCEIQCPDLSKVVYILFLRHPEGIRLKEIGDYKDELRMIYFTISPRSDMYAQNESINQLTDPTSGSLNQKISRISAAFRNCLNTESTQPYIISGKRGGIRKIQLAEDMISLPTELQF